jgi:hypothetical protein
MTIADCRAKLLCRPPRTLLVPLPARVDVSRVCMGLRRSSAVTQYVEPAKSKSSFVLDSASARTARIRNCWCDCPTFPRPDTWPLERDLRLGCVQWGIEGSAQQGWGCDCRQRHRYLGLNIARTHGVMGASQGASGTNVVENCPTLRRATPSQ